MDVIDQRPSEREAVLLQTSREELVERIGRTMRQDGSAQPLPGLHLYRHSLPLEQVYSLIEPSVCVVAQGSKEFLLCPTSVRFWKRRRSVHSSVCAWILLRPSSVRSSWRPVTSRLKTRLL